MTTSDKPPGHTYKILAKVIRVLGVGFLHFPSNLNFLPLLQEDSLGINAMRSYLWKRVAQTATL